MYQYFISIIPTTTTTADESLVGFQYAVHPYTRALSSQKPGSVGISFIYDKVKIISNFRISIFIFFSRNLWSFILLRVMNRFSIFCCDWPVCYLACSSCLTVFILPYFMFGIKINGIYNRNKLFLYCLLVNKCSHC